MNTYTPAQDPEHTDTSDNVTPSDTDMKTTSGAPQQSVANGWHTNELLTALRDGRAGADETGGNGAPPLATGPVDLRTAVVDGVEYRAHHFHADVTHAARSHVLGLNPQNVQVRPHRQLVEAYSQAGPWNSLSRSAAQDVVETLGRLPTTVQQDKEEAKTFDLTVVRAQLAQLTGDAGTLASQRQKIQDIAGGLLAKINVPAVKVQARLLEELVEDQWWEDATALMFEDVRRRLRDLVIYVDKRTWKPVQTTFTDEISEAREMDLARITPGTDLRRFKAKAARYLQQHLDTIALQKLRHNRQLTVQDLTALEDMLVESGTGTREDVQTAAAEAEGLGLFIRSLVGLDRAAVQESFNDFVSGSNFSADQLHFIQQVIDYLTANGAMEISALYEAPLSDNGTPDTIIGDDRLDVVVDILDEIRRRAAPVPNSTPSPAASGTDGRVAT